jgi:hypothetical protein
MKVSEVSRLSDDALRCALKELVAHDRTTTVRVLIQMAEFDSRRLYRAEGFTSMHAYCVGELRMSDDIAYKRISAARKGRKFPQIFVALNAGSLTLTAVAMLSRYLSRENAQELLRAADYRTNAQIAELIAQRFPRPDLPTLVQPLRLEAQSVAPIPANPAASSEPQCQELAARRVEIPTDSVPPRARVMPLAPARYGVQFTISQTDLELLRRAQDLMSHRLPSRNEGEVFVHALHVLVRALEKHKFAVTEKPRKVARRDGENPRYIPASVKRLVAERDGGRCTFKAGNGRRCEARGFLEFDHVLPVARGGKSTLKNLRLRCRAHNQYEAEQFFGAELMKSKAEGTRERQNASQVQSSSQGTLLPISSA